MVGTINVPGAVMDRMGDDAGLAFRRRLRDQGARRHRTARARVPGARARRGSPAPAAGSGRGGSRRVGGRRRGVRGVVGPSRRDADVVLGREVRVGAVRPRAVGGADPGDRTWRASATIRRSGSPIWLGTVADASLRHLDHQLLLDLLNIEAEPARWRDIAETATAHAEDLVRVGYFDQAWQLADAVVREGARSPARAAHATAALERFGRGTTMRHVSSHLRGSTTTRTSASRRCAMRSVRR